MNRLILGLALGAVLIVCSPAEARRARLIYARQTMSFIPGDRSRPLVRVPRQRRTAAAAPRRLPSKRTARRGADPGEGEPATSAPPGSGFKMEDGVLTYPAPARFQRKNLKIQ